MGDLAGRYVDLIKQYEVILYIVLIVKSIRFKMVTQS